MINVSVQSLTFNSKSAVNLNSTCYSYGWAKLSVYQKRLLYKKGEIRIHIHICLVEILKKKPYARKNGIYLGVAVGSKNWDVADRSARELSAA